MLLPIAILLFFNYNVVVGVASSDSTLKYSIYTTILMYVLTSLRGGSMLKNDRMRNKSK